MIAIKLLFKLNYQEANTLWTLLNNKPTFYMLVLGERSYSPEIKSLCGGLVELEEIKKHLYQKQDYCKKKMKFFVVDSVLNSRIISKIEFY
jgi:hypothetical protein